MTYKNDLSIDLLGFKMKTPIMTASGTCGYGLELNDFINLNELGALVVKGTTLKPKEGNCGQRAVETPAGMLNSIGLENPGVEHFLKITLPVLSKFDLPIIVNIAGSTKEEFAELAQMLDIKEISALELNISCPNVKEGGIAFGVSEKSATQVVEKVKKATKKPIITKLSPNVTDIVKMAAAVENAGSDAISLINTLVGMKIDIKRKAPVLGNIIGGLSGPAVRPIAVRMVYQIAQKINIPIIGMGGIMTAEDALEFILAGASAVAVGTGTLVNPDTVAKIPFGIDEYLTYNNYKNINEIKGLALPKI